MCVTYYIIDIKECESEPCQNNGVCNEAINSFECQCAVGFIGEKCETSECEFFLFKDMHYDLVRINNNVSCES